MLSFHFRFRFVVGLLPAFLLVLSPLSPASGADRPNILWITSEDNGPELGCYGDTYADTPRIDALAARSLRYRTCWSNAPVCAPARTTLISGMYATSLGGQHMRSGIRLPDDIAMYPAVLKQAGYFCTNNSKTDYNFAAGDDVGWDQSNGKAHFRNRPTPDTPFFSVFNFTISHESRIRNKPHELVHDPAKAPVPVYHPDVPEVRRDWAQYYDRVTQMDAEVGRVLDQLNADGLADSTIVFYYGDHGSGMPRSKRWPFHSGLHVPLIVHVPEGFKDLAPADYVSGGESKRLVSFVDFGPTAISLAGVQPPANMQGVSFAGQFVGPEKPLVFGYRGRMDERIDRVRSCTDGRFVYMRHFYPERPYLKHVDYMFQTRTTQVWKAMFDAGELTEAQAKFWQPKPVEELFDLEIDPDEVNNIADDPAHAKTLARMRSSLKQWMVDTCDTGVMPEAEMHRLCDSADPPIAPRTLATDDEFPIEALVDAAWAASDAWAVADESVITTMGEMAGAENSLLRYWGCRGLTLSLASHGSVLPPPTVARALQSLRGRLDDDSPSVAVAAAEGLLIGGVDEFRRMAADRLIELANVKNAGHLVAVDALNVIDLNRGAMGRALEKIDADFPRNAPAPPRSGGYVDRLLEHILE